MPTVKLSAKLMCGPGQTSITVEIPQGKITIEGNSDFVTATFDELAGTKTIQAAWREQLQGILPEQFNAGIDNLQGQIKRMLAGEIDQRKTVEVIIE